MESGEWKALLTLIPEEHQNHLVVMTTAGTEINIQTVLRLEEKYLVLRGRLAGTTDMGRIFFLPLDRLDYLAFQRALTEEEILAILGGQPMPGKEASESVPAVAPTAAAGLAPSQPEASAGPVPVAGPTPPLPSPPRQAGLLARLPSRSQILQQLRLRSAARSETENGQSGSP